MTFLTVWDCNLPTPMRLCLAAAYGTVIDSYVQLLLQSIYTVALKMAENLPYKGNTVCLEKKYYLK